MRKYVGVMVLVLLVWAPALAQTDTPTATPTITPTSTRTATITLTPTATRTLPPTKTVTATRTVTPVNTATKTPVNTATATNTPVPTATKTSVISNVTGGNAGCVALNATPVAIGTSGRRMALTYWCYDGPCVCGYNPQILPTPGASGGATYETGRSLSRCIAEDLALYCLAPDGSGEVCFDEVIQASPTVTATPTVTPTP